MYIRTVIKMQENENIEFKEIVKILKEFLDSIN